MTRLDDLRALRSQLQEWIVEAPADRKAALVGQYRATLAEIDELDPPKVEGDGIDEIARRRASRRSGPATAASRAN